MALIKEILKQTPALGPRMLRLKRAYDRRRFSGSANYWEDHYQAGGTSGPGSFGINAQFKARFLNEFVAQNGVKDVLEFGCGDGEQLQLANYPVYRGLDVSATSIAICAAKFAGDSSKRFYEYPSPEIVPGEGICSADLVISLDVIYHLVEDKVFASYMADLFTSSTRWVILYTSDSDEVDQVTAPHCRHRPVARYVASAFSEWSLTSRVENENRWNGDLDLGSLSNFYVYEKGAEATS